MYVCQFPPDGQGAPHGEQIPLHFQGVSSITVVTIQESTSHVLSCGISSKLRSQYVA